MFVKLIGLFAQTLTDRNTTIHIKAWGDLCGHVTSTRLFNVIVKERFIGTQSLQGESLLCLEFLNILNQLHAPYPTRSV